LVFGVQVLAEALASNSEAWGVLGPWSMVFGVQVLAEALAFNTED
jgi:hypothetical protein